MVATVLAITPVSHRLKKKAEIFKAVEGNSVSKQKKRMKTATSKELGSAMCKWLRDRILSI